nr:40S ribosomal protein S15a-5-like [Ipomoea batatas]
MGRRILNDALRTIVNAEKRGFASAQLQPISNVMANFLQIMKHRGYIKDFEVEDPHRVGKITVQLLGRINDCRAISYRQDIKAQNIENYAKSTLPTRQVWSDFFLFVLLHPLEVMKCSLLTQYATIWGYVVITTPNGVLDHEEAIRQNVGGQVLGYFY